ncbi:MAG: lysyl oxidase family protein [Actinomycetota bacterium]|nr:lysyl oxidase family protein [Actinomycetota bacterium]
MIVNIGDGPFQARGHTPQPNGELLVDGQIKNSDGSWTTYSVPQYQMYFAGDGHTHWHVRQIEKYVLRDTATEVKGVGVKAGYCFFDNATFKLSMPGAPQSPVYTGCGDTGDTEVTTGLSIGWGDAYPWKIPDQYIDITGLPNGQYSLTATADPLGGFTERCEGNNATTAVLQITGQNVTVVNQGKPSKRCAG